MKTKSRLADKNEKPASLVSQIADYQPASVTFRSHQPTPMILPLNVPLAAAVFLSQGTILAISDPSNLQIIPPNPNQNPPTAERSKTSSRMPFVTSNPCSSTFPCAEPSAEAVHVEQFCNDRTATKYVESSEHAHLIPPSTSELAVECIAKNRDGNADVDSNLGVHISTDVTKTCQLVKGVEIALPAMPPLVPIVTDEDLFLATHSSSSEKCLNDNRQTNADAETTLVKRLKTSRFAGIGESRPPFSLPSAVQGEPHNNHPPSASSSKHASCPTLAKPGPCNFTAPSTQLSATPDDLPAKNKKKRRRSDKNKEKTRKCNKCNIKGHYERNCPQKNECGAESIPQCGRAPQPVIMSPTRLRAYHQPVTPVPSYGGSNEGHGSGSGGGNNGCQTRSGPYGGSSGGWHGRWVSVRNGAQAYGYGRAAGSGHGGQSACYEESIGDGHGSRGLAGSEYGGLTGKGYAPTLFTSTFHQTSMTFYNDVGQTGGYRGSTGGMHSGQADGYGGSAAEGHY